MERLMEAVTDAIMKHRFPSGETLDGVLHDSWYFGTNYDATHERAHIRELCRGIAATALKAAGVDKQTEVSGSFRAHFTDLPVYLEFLSGPPPAVPQPESDSGVEIVRRRLVDGRTIADADVHRLVAEIDRLMAVVRSLGGSA